MLRWWDYTSHRILKGELALALSMLFLVHLASSLAQESGLGWYFVFSSDMALAYSSLSKNTAPSVIQIIKIVLQYIYCDRHSNPLNL